MRTFQIPLVLALVAGCIAVPGSAPAFAGGSVDWGSVTELVGFYHAVTIQNGGRRSEVKGTATLSFQRSYPVKPGQLAYAFQGTADSTVHKSRPSSADPCLAMGPPPDLSGHARSTGITLTIDTAHGIYYWSAQPIKLRFEVGGPYTPQCGSPFGPRHMRTSNAGGVSVGKLPLPENGEILCGKTVFSDPGDFTVYVDWMFKPKNVTLKNAAPHCPSVKKATGGTT